MNNSVKNINAWDAYDERTHKNLFRRDDLCFYSPKLNIFSYFTGYNYNSNGDIKQDVIQLFLDHTKNTICDGNEDLYEYILSWFSYILQKPSGKTE